MLKRKIIMLCLLITFAAVSTMGITFYQMMENYSTYNNNETGLVSILLFAMLISLVVAFIITLIVAHHQMKPISALMDMSNAIISGDLDTEIQINSNDDIEMLGENMNKIKEDIKKHIKKSKEDALMLRTIVDNLRLSVFVTDNKGKVILINRAAIYEFNIREHYETMQEYEQFKEFVPLLVKNILNEEIVNKKIKYNDKSYRLKLFYIKEDGKIKKVMITCEDITKIEKEEEDKREFVSSAAHELKTPITVIRGYAETFEMGLIDDPGMRYKMLDTVIYECERLTDLTNNLLELSNLEKSLENEMEISEINFQASMEAVADSFKYMDNNFPDIFVKVSDNLKYRTIRTNLSNEWFRVVLGNLISNAIKYSNEHVAINIEAIRREYDTIITVEDNGIGIKEEDIGQIFKRFYRVEKSRSKEVEGNGLGLTIVYNMVKRVNGNIVCESVFGQGTKFTITIPLIDIMLDDE